MNFAMGANSAQRFISTLSLTKMINSQAAKPLISEKWEKKGKVHFFAFLPYFNLIDWRDKQWHFATVGEFFFFGFQNDDCF